MTVPSEKNKLSQKFCALSDCGGGNAAIQLDTVAHAISLLGVVQSLEQSVLRMQSNKDAVCIRNNLVLLLDAGLLFPWEKFSVSMADLFACGMSILQKSSASEDQHFTLICKAFTTFFSYLEDGVLDCPDLPLDELFTAVVTDLLISGEPVPAQAPAGNTILSPSHLWPYTCSDTEIEEVFKQPGLSYGLYTTMRGFQTPAVTREKTDGGIGVLLASGEQLNFTSNTEFEFEPLFYAGCDQSVSRRLLAKMPPMLKILAANRFSSEEIEANAKTVIHPPLDLAAGTNKIWFDVDGEHYVFTLETCPYGQPDKRELTAKLEHVDGSGKTLQITRDDLPRVDSVTCSFVFPAGSKCCIFNVLDSRTQNKETADA